jgi:hypothetical protein
MFCEYFDEYVNEEKCECCEICGQFGPCEYQKDVSELNNSEIAKECRKKFKEILGADDESAERMTNGLMDSLSSSYRSNMKTVMEDAMKSAMDDGFKAKIEKHISGLFDESLKTLVLTEANEKYIKSTVEEVILGHVKKFFSSNWNEKDRRSRVINESIDNLISKVVSENVDGAIEEIKTECIDKFQKDVMKKMMHGMANEIACDKKLLGILTGD